MQPDSKVMTDYFLPPKAPTPPDPFRPRTTEEDQFPTGRNPPSTGSTETLPEGKAKAR